MASAILVQLIEPDGTINDIVTWQVAVAWCEVHPGWTWAEVEGGDHD